MPLQSELDAVKAGWVRRVGADIAQMVADDNASLEPLAAKALKSGEQFPQVELTDHLGRVTDLRVLTHRGPLVVTFYRGGWCPYCNLELRAYQEVLPEINKLGAQLVAVSPETPDNTLSTAGSHLHGALRRKGEVCGCAGHSFRAVARGQSLSRGGRPRPARA
jgi:thiol-disulfide isomerase/thioredoxin